MVDRALVLVAASLTCTAVLLSACPQDTVDVTATRSSRGGDDDTRDPDGPDDPSDPADPDDQCAASTNKRPLGASAVYFGTRNPSHVPLSASQMRAVVGVGQGRPPGASCSGTLITDTVVLTATHCTEGQSATRFYVTFGVDDEDPELTVDVIEKTEHPNLDIAMLRLAQRPADSIDVTPIAAFAGTLRESDVGELFEQAGFGQTENGRSNGRFFVAEPFDGFESGGFLRVDGEGRHGVCFGDSGGPSLRLTPEGDVRVVGALSFGDPSCTSIDRYTRVDLSRDWIEGFAGPIPAPGQTRPGCGSVSAAGRCSPDGRVAEFCDDDGLVQDACDDGEVCGDAGGTQRCIPTSQAPCGDITTFGECSGNVLSWCDGGVTRVRDCGACGGDVCGLVDNVSGFACVEDPCGGLTFQGECAGDTARWCDAGEIKTVNCAERGDTCGFVDDETGFFCQ